MFRSLGCTVQHLHMVGKGCPDILVGYRNINLLIEIKNGALVPSARKLTTDESGWHKRWAGQVCIVESNSDVLDLIDKTAKTAWGDKNSELLS